MKTSKLTKSILAVVAIAALAVPGMLEAQDFEFRAGYPTQESSQALYDEMDYQRAVQAYIWATPMLNAMGMRAGFHRYGVTEHNRKLLVFEYSLLPQHIWMTANSTTPYLWPMFSVKDGPWVVEIPPEAVLGCFYDFWNRALEDFGLPGPDRGKGGKYLILPPGYEGDIPKGYFVVKSTSYMVFAVGRANGAQYKGEQAIEIAKTINMYPLSMIDEKGNPPTPAGIVAVGKKEFSADWPKGYEAWEWIHEGMQLDNIRKTDKIIYDFLRSLGIEHGKPFKPDERQKRILTRAAETGHKMVMNLSFDNRNEDVVWWSDRQWAQIVSAKEALFETETYDEVTDRAQWYQLVGNTKIIYEARKREPTYGIGSAYLSSYKDNTGAYLNGSNSYHLKVPAKVPIANFWSVTVYDNEIRSMIRNEQKREARGSTDGLKVNADGTIDLYFGPVLPEGAPESNWVQTNQGDGWFVLFRFYGPEKPYYDRSWKLPDFEKIKEDKK